MSFLAIPIQFRHYNSVFIRFFAVASLVGAIFACSETPIGFDIRPGVEQITVTGAEAGIHLTLLDPGGNKLVTLITDKFGQASFAYIPVPFRVMQSGREAAFPSYKGTTVKPGGGYRIRNESLDPPVESEFIRVLSKYDVRDAQFYAKQTLKEGFNYIEARDGTRLSATVWFPEASVYGLGPWPTVITYSGYSPSNPDNQPPGALLATLMGYAAVGVNMRGSGCSGGVFDIFNPAQHADGYDIIEVAAGQDFVMHNKVGMVGLSYPGISQLYAASTQPPSLAAIAPLSVIDDPWIQQWPGGVYNSGFTKNWLEGRDKDAAPGGTSWVGKRIEEGDSICASNMNLRNQNIDFEIFGKQLEFYQEEAAARRLSNNLVRNIDVPVFLTGAWQDEQTGSRFAVMLDDFDNAPVKRFTMFNGHHPDGYTPLMLSRWREFLELYVAKRLPFTHLALRAVGAFGFEDIFGFSGLGFEKDRFLQGNTWENAIEEYEKEDDVRILFESGFGSSQPYAPVARYETSFPSWPPPAEARVWYLNDNEALTVTAPTLGGIDSYQHDATAGSDSYITHDSIKMPETEWHRTTTGYTLSYLTPPLAADMVVAGNGGYANLWFASDATQANVEVNILEVTPDGTEWLVQSGVFSMRHRLSVDSENSGPFQAEYSYREEFVSALVPGEFVEVKIPIRAFAHSFRAGSRLRMMVNTPGRESPFWAYENPEYRTEVWHQVAHTPSMASYLKLPEVSGVNVPASRPPCPSLRGLVCRSFVPILNHVVK